MHPFVDKAITKLVDRLGELDDRTDLKTNWPKVQAITECAAAVASYDDPNAFNDILQIGLNAGLETPEIEAGIKSGCAKAEIAREERERAANKRQAKQKKNGAKPNGHDPAYSQDAERGWHQAGPDPDPGSPPDEPEPQPQQIRFKLLSFAELKASPISEYLIKGLFPRHGLAVVWGPPKCGKSFWVFDAVMHMADGRPYRGRRVQPGEIVYLALEGQSGFGNRAEAWRWQFLEVGADVPNFRLCDAAIDLIKDHEWLTGDIKRQSANPAAVVIDTANRSLVGSENDPEDMANYLRAADAVRKAFNCLVIIIHHCGINGERPRGHTSLTGAADVQIAVKKDETGLVVTKVELAKDMEEGAEIVSRLHVVKLGLDQDGDEITSCVVVPASGEIAKANKKAKAMPNGAKIALKALTEAILEVGRKAEASNHVPPDVKVVSVENWRQYAYRMGISDGEERAQQIAFKKAAEYLIGNQHAARWGTNVWQVRNP